MAFSHERRRKKEVLPKSLTQASSTGKETHSSPPIHVPPSRAIAPATVAPPARRGAGRRPPREAHPTFLPPPEPLAWRPGQGGRQRGGGAPNNIPAAEAAQAPSSCSDSGSGDGEGPAAAKGELPRGQGPDHKHGNHPHSSGTTASQEDNTPGSIPPRPGSKPGPGPSPSTPLHRC